MRPTQIIALCAALGILSADVLAQATPPSTPKGVPGSIPLPSRGKPRPSATPAPAKPTGSDPAAPVNPEKPVPGSTPGRNNEDVPRVPARPDLQPGSIPGAPGSR